jgi:tetratricopeptide (TPR) repeat protein
MPSWGGELLRCGLTGAAKQSHHCMSRRVSQTPLPRKAQVWVVPGAWIGLALFVVTLVAYAPAITAEFIWNDSDYVTAPELRSLSGLGRIWFEVGATEQYYPLLHSAFWVQHQLWGDAPTGYHLVNILLHATAACLLVVVLRRLAIPGAWLAGFIFALHPVYVESVAWISEQKNTLSLVFYLVAALIYLRFDHERRRSLYFAATGVFVLALLSKSVTATLPAALLVVLWWKRGHLDWKRDVVPLLPWLVLGAAMGLFSGWVEKTYVGAQGSEFDLSLLQRSLLAGRIAWFYVGKLFWPADLIFIYPRWTIDPSQAWQWFFSLAVIAALIGLWLIRGRWRAPLAAVLFFGGSLVPTLGFFNVYAFIYSYVADHWQYLPSIGLVVLASAGITRGLAAKSPAWRYGLPGALLAVLAVLSFQQSRMYADMRTFYATTIAKNPECWMAYNNLGNLLRDRGELPLARVQFEEALRVRPDLHKVHYNLGNVLWDLRLPIDALGAYERAVEVKPDYPEARNHLGRVLLTQGRRDEALLHLQEALRLDPEYHDARNNLGMALRDAGRLDEAVAEFERVIRAAPTMAAAHLNLALSLSILGRTTEAMESYQTARRLNPAIPALR